MENKSGGLEGYLKKKSPKTVLGKHPWQRRWFVLQDLAADPSGSNGGGGVRLIYFKSEKEAHTPLNEPLGVIPLDRVVKVELMAHKIGRFNVHVEGNRIFALWAASTVEAQKWIGHISTLRSHRPHTLSALDKDQSAAKFWKVGSASGGSAAQPHPSPNGNGSSAAPNGSDSTNQEAKSAEMVKCQGFLTRDIKSKDGHKTKGFTGRFWCQATEHTLFLFQPEMAHKENAPAMGYLTIRDVVNSDFKEGNAWFHLETRDEVWTLSVSDHGLGEHTPVDAITTAKAKQWFACINRFLEDKPRDVTEVLKQAEAEIEQRRQSQAGGKGGAPGSPGSAGAAENGGAGEAAGAAAGGSKSASPKPASRKSSREAAAAAAETHVQGTEGAKPRCCGCF